MNYIQIDIRYFAVSPQIKVSMQLTNTDPDTGVTSTVYLSHSQVGATSEKRTLQSGTFRLQPGENKVEIITSTEGTDENGAPKTFTQTYTLTILRQQDVFVTMHPGNSPVGLIYGSDNIADADKDNAAADFAASGTNYYTYDIANTPNKAVNTMFTRYSAKAWTETNYDLDKTALFVYSGDTFVDPGYEDLMQIDKAPVSNDDVTITLKDIYTFTQPLASTPDLLTNNLRYATHVGDVILKDSGGTNNLHPDSDGETVIDYFATHNVRPGVYTLEYEFFDVAANANSTFSRAVILLPKKGDVNIDGVTDHLDADILYQRMNNTDTDTDSDGDYNDGFYSGIINGTDEWTQVYAYRTGDVTEDINVNSVDANAVLNGADITDRQYYERLPSAKSAVMATFDPTLATPAPTAVPVPTSTPKPVLALDYLGKADAPALKRTEKPGLTENDVYDSNKINNSTIWLGVGIRNAENLEYFLDGLYSVDIAIDYDPDLFEPCSIGNITKSDGTSTDFLADYADTIEEYNLKALSGQTVTTSDPSIWANAVLYNDSLQTDMHIERQDTTENKYKTVFVTIKSPNGTSLRLSNFVNPKTSNPDRDTIYLLQVPFRLKEYPDLDTYKMSAVKLNLTEQTFVLGATENGVTNSASWEGASLNKTTEVNNAYNHFDLEEVDIFGSAGTFNIKGKLRGWNPDKNHPFVIEFYKRDADTGVIEDAENPEYTFKSTETETNSLGVTLPKYGPLTYETDGRVAWEYTLPVSDKFDYTMVIKKMSHLTYPDIPITRETGGVSNITDGVYNEQCDIELLVGDIDVDGFVKIPDRVSLIRLFNEQKPWDTYPLLYPERYDMVDLNGDGTINLFDLNLLNTNMNINRVTAYTFPTPSPTP